MEWSGVRWGGVGGGAKLEMPTWGLQGQEGVPEGGTAARTREGLRMESWTNK